jgi:lipid-binding SYLF domain-containing protein
MVPRIEHRPVQGEDHAYRDCHCCNHRSHSYGHPGPARLGAGCKKRGERQDREARSNRKESQTTLAKLYKAQPGAKAALQKAVGYAAFDNFGMNLFVISTASGKGMVVDKASKKETFMKMVSGGVGLGLGAKDFRVVLVFESKKALNDFINSGWDGDAHAEAAAKSGQKGAAYEGAISVAPGVWVYQLTETGLALQATLFAACSARSRARDQRACCGGRSTTKTTR